MSYPWDDPEIMREVNRLVDEGRWIWHPGTLAAVLATDWWIDLEIKPYEIMPERPKP